MLRNSQKVGISLSLLVRITFYGIFFHERGAILHHKFLLPQIFGRGGVSGAQAGWKYLKRTKGRVASAFDGSTTPVFSSFEYRVIYSHTRRERGMELAKN